MIELPPSEVVEKLRLDPFYRKYISAGGLPVVSSEKVSDYALREAAWVVEQMLAGREDIRAAMIRNRTRLVVMAFDELTTQIPEHSDLRPGRFWDRRARGLGATHARPAVSCGEENLLRYPGDPYDAESILVHEFAHAIHQMGLESIDPSFNARLQAAYDAAMAEGLWQGTYAATNTHEYWAEGVQSWFDTNRQNDDQHNHVDTREELCEYDPRLAELIRQTLGEREWRYSRPETRAGQGHLAGYDASAAPRFAWPAELEAWYAAYTAEQRRAATQPAGPRPR